MTSRESSKPGWCFLCSTEFPVGCSIPSCEVQIAVQVKEKVTNQWKTKTRIAVMIGPSVLCQDRKAFCQSLSINYFDPCTSLTLNSCLRPDFPSLDCSLTSIALQPLIINAKLSPSRLDHAPTNGSQVFGPVPNGVRMVMVTGHSGQRSTPPSSRRPSTPHGRAIGYMPTNNQRELPSSIGSWNPEAPLPQCHTSSRNRRGM